MGLFEVSGALQEVAVDLTEFPGGLRDASKSVRKFKKGISGGKVWN